MIKVIMIDFDKLINAIDEANEASLAGDAKAYEWIGMRYAPEALKAFKSLGFFWAMENRRKCLLLQGINATPYDQAFWSDTDLILLLASLIK
jgi:hypothetical protein